MDDTIHSFLFDDISKFALFQDTIRDGLCSTREPVNNIRVRECINDGDFSAFFQKLLDFFLFYRMLFELLPLG